MRKRTRGKGTLILAAGIILPLLLYGCTGRREGEVLLLTEREAGTVESRLEENRQEAVSSGEDRKQGAEEAEQSRETMRIKVYVCGAVRCPGVVELSPGSRVEDALRAAGGFGENAAQEAVNLADWVSDGQQLYFPETGGEMAGQETAVRETEKEQGLVNINTAGPDRLCTLPGIGPSRAADIVAYREKNGGFSSCSDIMKVSGIKNSVYEKICDMITVK